uniref:Secreted protein n=1 Tax=Macrostomum lignano TaxID=282301 RepID=A0A1I8JPB0_9PLAT
MRAATSRCCSGPHGVAFVRTAISSRRELDEHKGLNGDDDFDPYWTPPGRLDSLLVPALLWNPRQLTAQRLSLVDLRTTS